jgi:hypothetical protein
MCLISQGQQAGTDLPSVVVKQLFEDICNKGCSDDEVAQWKSNLKYELHDLNDDGVPELFIYIEHSDWCGAGHNCSYWVFQKKRGGYILLLNDKELRVLDTSTNGYRDLASETPVGFCGKNVQRLFVTPYKYDGKKYQARPDRMDCKAFTPPTAAN